MGRSRYFCDHCCTSYPYSREARKKHNGGSNHSLCRKLHYDKFKSNKQKYDEIKTKQMCRNYLIKKECSYGDSCKHSHLTSEDLENLRIQAELEVTIAEYGAPPSAMLLDADQRKVDEFLLSLGLA